MATSAPLANQLIINWDPMCLNIEERAKVLADLRRAIQLYESAQENNNEQAPREMDTSFAEQAEFVPGKTKNKRKRKRTRPPSESSSSDVNLISSSSSEDEAEAESKERPPPPIRILRKEMWAKIHSGLQKADIPIRFAKNTTEAVLVYPQTVSGFRAITSLLDKSKIPYTTNQLRQDKDLEVVIRGVNETLSDDILLEELQNKIPATKSVFRMKKGEKIWPLLVVHLDPSAPSAKTIYDLKSLSGLSVKVEPKRRNSTIPQCLRCLKFSHTANCCHAPWSAPSVRETTQLRLAPARTLRTPLLLALIVKVLTGPLTGGAQKPLKRNPPEGFARWRQSLLLRPKHVPQHRLLLQLKELPSVLTPTWLLPLLRQPKEQPGELTPT